MSRFVTLIVPANEERRRLDVYLADQTLELSRSYIQTLIDEDHVMVNGEPAKCSHTIKPGEEVYIEIPDPEQLNMTPQDIPLDIIYEDDHLAVINKAPGMVVHPSPGWYSGTLVNALLHHFKNLSVIAGVQRPGIVHRLDRGTSGLIVIAKDDAAHHSLSDQLKSRTLTRKYMALVHYHLRVRDGYIETLIGRHPIHRKKMGVVKKEGKIAGTYYKLLKLYNYVAGSELFPFSLVECKLTTGRTHQIRVHMAHLRHPVAGDLMYGNSQFSKLPKSFKDQFIALDGVMLHARVIGFIHPVTAEHMEFSVEPPPQYQAILASLNEIEIPTYLTS